MYNKTQLYKRYVSVYTEAVPNPNSMKFVLNSLLAEDETLSREYAEAQTATDSPLAQALFGFQYVQRIFMTKNFITITKSPEMLWENLVPELKNFIKNYIEEGKPIFNDQTPTAQPTGNVAIETDSPTVKQIKNILEEYIRPAVEGDGGAITFHSFDEATGQVKLLLQGSCSGCPSSTVTLKAGIENLLKRMLPNQVREVVAEGV